MGKNFIHPSLGFFIERTRKQSGVTIETLCKDLHISPSTYIDLKKGCNASLSTYETLLRYYSMNWRNWMMTKSGNWLGNGWKNGWRLGRRGSGDWIG